MNSTQAQPPSRANRSAASATTRHRTLRSIGAVAAGFLTVALLSLVTDEILHVLGVYHPWGQPMYEVGLNVLAFTYRSLFTVAGMYLTARLAPRAPMRHALVCGAIGTIVATGAAFATIPMHLGPPWYPILLALTPVPLAWLGAKLCIARRRSDP